MPVGSSGLDFSSDPVTPHSDNMLSLPSYSNPRTWHTCFREWRRSSVQLCNATTVPLEDARAGCDWLECARGLGKQFAQNRSLAGTIQNVVSAVSQRQGRGNSDAMALGQLVRIGHSVKVF
jgi:hypothetical protein